MEKDLISQGLELTLFGMGTVVVFLTLLVFVTTGMSAFVGRVFPAPPAPPEPVTPAAEPDAAVMAVITAAVHRYRQEGRLQDRTLQSKQEQNS